MTLMVTEESATKINGCDDWNNHKPLFTDHSGLVKFQGLSDNKYTNIVEPRIKDMVKRAPGVVHPRFTGVTST